MVDFRAFEDLCMSKVELVVKMSGVSNERVVLQLLHVVESMILVEETKDVDLGHDGLDLDTNKEDERYTETWCRRLSCFPSLPRQPS